MTTKCTTCKQDIITHQDCKERSLGQYLCEWGDLTYEQVLAALYKGENIEDAEGEDIITIWEGVEDDPYEDIAEKIEEEYTSICRFIGLSNEEVLD